MNKDRPNFRPEQTGPKMCASFVENGSCKFLGQCKFSHDLAARFAARPADLGELCPIYTLRGFCKFGVNCRFGLGHVSAPDGANVCRPVEPPPPAEINVVPWDLTNRLRKSTYNLAKANALAKKMSAEMERLHLERQYVRGYGEAPEPRAEPAEPAGSEEPAPAPERLLGVSAEQEAAWRARLAESSAAAPKKERKPVDFRGKLYLAPLTTVGNLPFRRICKEYGADITCGEMAMATNLLQGQASEWALMKRHPCEDVFGVQIAGGAIEPMGRIAQVIDENLEVDFVDINMGCPIDVVCNKGSGSALATKPGRVQGIVRTMSTLLSCPLTVKMRMGFNNNNPTAHNMIPNLQSWGAAAVTLHGRSRQQRYSKSADWGYIGSCAPLAGGIPLIGNGDVFSYENTEFMLRHGAEGGADGELVVRSAAADGESGKAAPAAAASSAMVARGALVKPWLFTELKERRHWDISSAERLETLRKFTRYGLEHWGTDDVGVARTRNFMLEWLSFLHRYVPVGLLERLPAKMQDRPPSFVGRDELETLMASPNSEDWVKITELLLGKAPSTFNFLPKHKANAYAKEGEEEKGPILAE